MSDNERIFNIKQKDIKNGVIMEEVHEGEYISHNGNWSVTKHAIYFNYEDTSYPIGDMEDVPDVVQEVYNQLQNEK